MIVAELYRIRKLFLHDGLPCAWSGNAIDNMSAASPLRKAVSYTHLNLYLFSYYGIPAGMFFSVMLPPFILSTVLILLCCLLFPKDRLTVPEAQVVVDRRRAAVYGGLFCLAVAMVLRLIPYGPGLAVIVLALWFLDRHALKSVDWGLLAKMCIRDRSKRGNR